ncbi:MAG: hypothetical protein RLZZ591_2159, partial [Pseudomonadota bacterium]
MLSSPAKSPNRCQFGLYRDRLKSDLLPRWRQVRAASVGHLRRHTDAFAQGGVGVDGFAYVHGIRAHLDGQGNFADHVSRVGTDHAAAQDLAEAVGLGAVI